MSQTHAAPFEKYHGAGNDFVVVDAEHPAVRGIPDRGAFAATVCDRQSGVSATQNADDAVQQTSVSDGGTGTVGAVSTATVSPEGDIDHETRIGADGVLFLSLSAEFRPSRVVMTLVQPDGSVAAMCGNGARCAAQWAHERTGETEFMIDTQSGTRYATVDTSSSWDGEVEIEMGHPEFNPAVEETPIEGLEVTAVDTGVPHAVSFVDDVADVDLATVAPPVRYADIFPEGTNVTIASRVGSDGVESPTDTESGDDANVPVFRQRTYERGVEGETRACGTGAVAIAAVAKHLGLVDADTVTLRPPGGDLLVHVPDDGPALLSGPVKRDYSGTVLPGVAETPGNPPATE